MMSKTLKRTIAICAGVVVLAAWIAAAAAFLMFDPTIGQWTAIVTAVALITEAAVWICVVLLGITALQRFSLFASRRRPAAGSTS
jgi:hypothetical protein